MATTEQEWRDHLAKARGRTAQSRARTALDLDIQRLRRAKAERLADVLIEAGADGTEEFDAVTWQLAHRAAGVNAPSALTRDLAMWIIRDRQVRP